MRRLIQSAREQWQAQLSDEQFANVAIQPAVPEHFTEFYAEVLSIKATTTATNQPGRQDEEENKKACELA